MVFTVSGHQMETSDVSRPDSTYVVSCRKYGSCECNKMEGKKAFEALVCLVRKRSTELILVYLF